MLQAVKRLRNLAKGQRRIIAATNLNISPTSMSALPRWIARIVSLSAADANDYFVARFKDLLTEEDRRLENGFVPDDVCWNPVPIATRNADLVSTDSPVSVATTNEPRNRYSDILPFNYNRVVLNTRISEFSSQINSSESSNYINASFVGGFPFCSSYIATQGPLDSTICDFYHMMLDQKSRVVIMLTPLVEKGRVKCAKYWPDVGKSMQTKDLQLHTISETTDLIHSELLIRKIRVKCPDSSSTEITQIHFTDWADHRASAIEIVLRVINVAEGLQKEYSEVGPMVAHCSAGCGRTGTFIAIACCKAIIQSDGIAGMSKETDLIYEIVGLLRQQRVTMVQTLEQFRFCYQVILFWIQSTTKSL
ncbi:hypothetical protein HK096_008795 [Nowakowskiella sp. JEL0078]|nr:hypothetical protein HK096_008795 [Nowakowskiella sp. JEL0078]